MVLSNSVATPIDANGNPIRLDYLRKLTGTGNMLKIDTVIGKNFDVTEPSWVCITAVNGNAYYTLQTSDNAAPTAAVIRSSGIIVPQGNVDYFLMGDTNDTTRLTFTGETSGTILVVVNKVEV